MKEPRMKTILFVALVLVARIAPAQINHVTVAPATFNPSEGQKVSIRFNSDGGHAKVLVLDRDGYVTRELLATTIAPGTTTVSWDGRDAAGVVVADEAYSFKITVGKSTYFPASAQPRLYRLRTNYYDRDHGVLVYELPEASRIHLQAGIATGAYGSTEGAVLKTIVNRSPRPAGPIVEPWNGLDESGTIYVPDHARFVTSVLATALPEHSVITFGNKKRSFIDVARTRTGKSHLRAQASGGHAHHHALSALDDISPSLNIEVRRIRDRAMARVTLSGPTAANVARHPGQLFLFVDYKKVAQEQLTRGRNEVTIEIPLEGGEHLITANWQSAYGPLAANSHRLSGAAQ